MNTIIAQRYPSVMAANRPDDGPPLYTVPQSIVDQAQSRVVARSEVDITPAELIINPALLDFSADRGNVLVWSSAPLCGQHPN